MSVKDEDHIEEEPDITRLAVDMRTGKETRDVHLGATGFISWPRLVETLRATGELRSTEDVAIIAASRKGLRYIVTERKLLPAAE